MIVDDSNVIRNRIARSICKKRFQIVAEASNGKDAINKFISTTPKVVTMDLTMPEMDGLECIKLMTSMRPLTKILVISALSDKDTGIKALELGAQGFILKPFSEEQLIDALLELTED